MTEVESMFPLIQSVSFVIPAHNEQECIISVIDKSLLELETLGIAGEVVVVDDASTDETRDLVAAASANDTRVRLLASERNVGPQRCIMRGFQASIGDVAFFIPADLQVLPSELGSCLPALNTADIVCTNRIPRADNLQRRAMSATYNWLVKRLVGLTLSDIDSCMLVRRRVIDALVPALKARGDFLQVELVARALIEGFVVTEVPVRHFARAGGRPSAITPHLVARTFLDLFRLSHDLRDAA